MGIGFRVFFVEEDDTLRRIPLARYERLTDDAHEESIPEYACKRMRCALVSVEMEKRKPKSIMRIDCMVVPFDSEGKIDTVELEKKMRLVGEYAFPLLSIFGEQEDEKIVDARGIFAKKRHAQEYTWVLDAEIEAAIVVAVFGKPDTSPFW